MKKLMMMGAMIMIVLALTACSNKDMGTTGGAALGGVAGYALTGGSPAGAVAGAVGGGVVGYQLSK